MLLTLSEVARRLGVSQKLARQIAKDENFPVVSVGKRLRYPADVISRFACVLPKQGQLATDNRR